MAAPGEGKVRDAVEGEDGRKGASGQQDNLAADIERYVVKDKEYFRLSNKLPNIEGGRGRRFMCFSS